MFQSSLYLSALTLGSISTCHCICPSDRRDYIMPCWTWCDFKVGLCIAVALNTALQVKHRRIHAIHLLAQAIGSDQTLNCRIASLNFLINIRRGQDKYTAGANRNIGTGRVCCCIWADGVRWPFYFVHLNIPSTIVIDHQRIDVRSYGWTYWVIFDVANAMKRCIW